MSTTIIMAPDIQQKLAILGSEASEEVTDVPATQSIQQGITHATGFIYNASGEGTDVFDSMLSDGVGYRTTTGTGLGDGFLLLQAELNN